MPTMNYRSCRRSFLAVALLSALSSTCQCVLGYVVQPPPISRATGLPNRSYDWRHQQIRYQAAGDPSSPNAVVLVHGLFVNSDHWRHTITDLADEGYRVYAVDLLGSGYSSKPLPWDKGVGKLVNGENGRFDDVSGSVLKNVKLGTSNGGSRTADVDLRHPLGSPYNFYTWSEQICDFTREVVLGGDEGNERRVTLVGNSKGTIVSLQAATDCPDLFNGVFCLNPTFREMHSAETPKWSMPILQAVQRWLRESKNSRSLYAKIAQPPTIKKILQEPYAVSSAVDDELVDALLSPLLSPDAPDVVFDTLSYTGGPLPEQILADESDFPSDSVPVWISYGADDPWTPAKRVQRMEGLRGVEKVIPLKGVGHCPHDEAPELVNPLLLDFMERVRIGQEAKQTVSASASASPSTDVVGVREKQPNTEKKTKATNVIGPFGMKPAYR